MSFSQVPCETVCIPHYLTFAAISFTSPTEEKEEAAKDPSVDLKTSTTSLRMKQDSFHPKAQKVVKAPRVQKEDQVVKAKDSFQVHRLPEDLPLARRLEDLLLARQLEDLLFAHQREGLPFVHRPRGLQFNHHSVLCSLLSTLNVFSQRQRSLYPRQVLRLYRLRPCRLPQTLLLRHQWHHLRLLVARVIFVTVE